MVAFVLNCHNKNITLLDDVGPFSPCDNSLYRAVLIYICSGPDAFFSAAEDVEIIVRFVFPQSNRFS
jgi:hypothetical protein